MATWTQHRNGRWTRDYGHCMAEITPAADGTQWRLEVDGEWCGDWFWIGTAKIEADLVAANDRKWLDLLKDDPAQVGAHCSV